MIRGEPHGVIDLTIPYFEGWNLVGLPLEVENPDYELIGNLLMNHHAVLRDLLKVSTPKIEAMLEAALNAGALGGKINGSGGGGCMFAFAPDNPQSVAEAIEKVSGEATIIRYAEGTKIVFLH